jgi:hypothetical protein
VFNCNFFKLKYQNRLLTGGFGGLSCQCKYSHAEATVDWLR